MELLAPPSLSEFTDENAAQERGGAVVRAGGIVERLHPRSAQPLTTTLSRLLGLVGWVSIIVEPLNDRFAARWARPRRYRV